MVHHWRCVVHVINMCDPGCTDGGAAFLAQAPYRCIMGERCQFLSQLFGPCGMSSRWPQTLPSRYGLYGSSFLAIAFVGSPVNPSDEILHKWNIYVTACSNTSTLTRWQRSVRQYPHDSHVCFVHRKFVLSPAASHW